MAFDLVALKKSFFDRAAVKGAVDKGTRAALSKFGAFVRTRARSSIKKRKAPAPPGSPPSSHTGALKKIFFGYDQARASVVIGPVLAASQNGTPERLETGGAFKGKRYAPRPFMAPAFKTELQKVGNNFRNLIK